MAEKVYLGYTNRRNGQEAWLYGNAGLAYLRAIEAGAPGGYLSDAGRTNAEQWDMWNKYLRGELVATAAYPGTSKHETGRALDIAEPARTWWRENGHKFGFMRDRVSREPWHFEYEWWLDPTFGQGDPRDKEWFEGMKAEDERKLREIVRQEVAREINSNARIEAILSQVRTRLNANVAEVLGVARETLNQARWGYRHPDLDDRDMRQYLVDTFAGIQQLLKRK